MAIKVILLDVDGTIANSKNVWYENIIPGMLLELGIIPKNNHLLDIIKMSSSQAVSEYINTTYSANITPQYVGSALSRIGMHIYKEKVTLKKGFREFMSFINQSGTEAVILTGCQSQIIREFFKKNALDKYFKIVLTQEDIAKLNFSKTQPGLYQMLSSMLGIKTCECVSVDDSLISLKAAKDAGMHIIGVNDNHNNQTLSEMVELCGKENIISDFYEGIVCLDKLILKNNIILGGII